jgi:pantothenate synthetase
MERDQAQKQLQIERMEFIRTKEAWALERKRHALATAEEHKALAMEKALLEARKDAIAEMEVELTRLKEREAAQIQAGVCPLFYLLQF